jgi:hypothetical protein
MTCEDASCMMGNAYVEETSSGLCSAKSARLGQTMEELGIDEIDGQ